MVSLNDKASDLSLRGILASAPEVLHDKGAQIFQKSRSHHKILRAKMCAMKQMHSEDSQTFGTAQNSVA
jgi:hypothetical protein